MAFPESVLEPDEQLIVDLRPHWRGLVRPALFACVLSLLAGVGGGLVETQLAGTPEQGPVWATIAVLGALLAVPTIVLPVARWARTTLVVTDRRVLYRAAGIRRRGVDIPLGRISAVRYRHTIVERALGTGSLLVEMGYLPPVEIDEVPHVASVHATLYDELSRLRVAAAPQPAVGRGARIRQRLFGGGGGHAAQRDHGRMPR